MNGNVRKVVEVARSWERHNLHKELKGSPGETCAFFVRYVFMKALHRSGIMPVAHNRPYYKEHQVQALPTNENFADGLAGDVIGQKIPLNQAQAGDILLFRDTYFSSEFPRGSITHVAIALDSNGTIADSSGGLCFVRNHHSTFRNLLVEVRRPNCLWMASEGTGITLSKGMIHRSNVSKEMKILYGVSEYEKRVMGKYAGPKPQVLVDNRSIQYQYISIDVTMPGGKHIKMFHHDGKTSAYVEGKKVPYLNVEARIQGGLHVWVEGKEIKPSAINIGVS